MFVCLLACLLNSKRGDYLLTTEITNRRNGALIRIFNYTLTTTTGAIIGHIIVNNNFGIRYVYHVLLSGCGQNLYGPTCSIICVPTDDNTGHFTCGSNGEINCLPGYTNSAGDGGRCLTCVSSTCQEEENDNGGGWVVMVVVSGVRSCF